MMRALLVLAMLGPWALAIAAWPELPERIPIHFDAAGRPDGWAGKSAWWWFALPALATAIGALLAFGLPRWMVAMARSNSPWLNVPRKQQFMALPVDARERAIRAPLPWLTALACCVQVLIGWIVHGSARVASGEWDVLPAPPSFVLVGTVIACAIGLAIAGTRAVRVEIDRAARGAQ
jgi:uncharacterized membrane protein